MSGWRLSPQLITSSSLSSLNMTWAPDGGGGFSRKTSGVRSKISGFVALEPRLMFDGAGVETAADIASDLVNLAEDHDDGADLLLAALGDTQDLATALVFIDANVDTMDVLIAAMGPDVEVHILTADRDGVSQIADVVFGRSNIAALHIISHGQSGMLELGSAQLTEASMAGHHADELNVIRAALSQDADILLYGCEFSAGPTGQAAMQALANATGADVAASDDLTGAERLGGDWVLEDQVGLVETGMLRLDAWSGTLNLVNTGNWTVSGATASNTTSGVTSTITFTPTAGGTVALNATPQVFNTSTGLLTNGAEGDASLGFVYTWDTTPEAATAVPQPDASTDDAPMTVTITFSTPVTNPIINIDRLGGNGTFDPNTTTVGGEDSRSNSSLWTLTTPGASRR